jgi:hypothetical protein
MMEDLAEVLDRAESKIKKRHCADCGGIPAHVPMACVMNMHTAVLDTYRLQLPPLCDACALKRGISRRGVLAPKTSELQNSTEILTALMEKMPDWSKRSLERSIKELVSQGMTEEDAKSMLGVE